MQSCHFLICTLALALLPSCVSLKTRTAHTADIQGPVVHTPVLADLDVQGTKASATTTAPQGNSIDAIKNMAIAEVLHSTGADVLVEPTFDVQKKGGKNVVTVSGFPATYKNFRPARPEDIPLMDAGARYQTTTAKSESMPEKKKGAGGIIAALAGAALLVLIIAGH